MENEESYKRIKEALENASPAFTLSEQERGKIRANLKEYMTYRPVTVISPESERLTSYTWSTNVLAVITNKKITMPALIVGLILTLSGGTAIAAEGALPGDTLYPVKVGVNEEIRSAFTFSPEARAEWEVERAERRLAEVERLAAEGRLNAEQRATIESRIASHVEEAEENANSANADVRADVATEVATRLEAIFAAHEEVLANVRERVPAEAQVHIDAVLDNARARTQALAAMDVAAEAPAAIATLSASARVESTADAAADIEEVHKESVERARSAAEAQIAKAVNIFARTKDTLSTEITARIQTGIESAQSAFARGDTELESGSYANAKAQFTSAFRTALGVTTSLTTHMRLLDLGISLNADANAEANTETSTNENREETDSSSESNGTSSETNASVTTDATVNVENSGVEAESNTNATVNVDGGASAEGSIRGTVRAIFGR